MADREGTRPPPSRDVAGEDFLFHLYRGSELLQDNRVHDAKAELEQALSLQPHDPKGQDLLGIVYFRLGLYPRAIAIFESLIQAHPEAVEPRINLALSYLKTGQPAHARTELERVLESQPTHARAWGYLGLAFQRMGDFERASHAFQAGGHDQMARRVAEMTPSNNAPPLSLRPEPPAGPRAEARRAARDAFQEIDKNDAAFRPDRELYRVPSGTWSAIEPGREVDAAPPASLVPSLTRQSAIPPPPTRSVPPPASSDNAPDSLAEPERPSIDATRSLPPPSFASPSSYGPPSLTTPSFAAPLDASTIGRDLLLVYPKDAGVAQHASGVVLVQAQSGFSTRLDLIRSMLAPSSAGAPKTLTRKARGRLLDEPLGGHASPIVELDGKVELVLAARPTHRLVAIALDENALYLREDAVAAFETTVTWDNGRLPAGDGEAIGMVQLRGPGSVVAELPASNTRVRVHAVEVTEGRTLTLRAVDVVGWLGRVVPRALVASEAPLGMRGFVAFSGEGMVLLDGR
jgi:uncharacterized protein (AIM24 family)